MVLKKPILSLALLAGLAIAVPAGASAAAPPDPVAHSAGGDVPPLNPSVVGVPITRTQTAIDNAADAVDEGQGATAAGPLRASRRYLIRSYRGAKFLIANTPPAPLEEARVSARTIRELTRRAIRASRGGVTVVRDRIRVRASMDDAAGPVFADAPTAVFNVLTSQYGAATAAVGMLPDVQGNLLNRVKITLNTAIVLRNRLVKVVAAAAPPEPPEDARASQDSDDAATFDIVMPGLSALLEDEIQQMRATIQDASVPTASRDVLTSAIAANQQIQQRVNTLWPPEIED